MLTLKLIRKSSAGKAVFGTMVLPLEQGEFVADTIENADFLIPAGKYPLRLTWSPRFKKLMPLIDEVPLADTALEHEPKYILAVSTRACSALPKNVKFSGAPDFGTKPEHSQGCVLVSYLALENLKVLFNQRKKWYEEDEMQIEIREK